MSSQRLPTDFAMVIEYFESDAPSKDVAAALRRDGAAVVRDQVCEEVADAVLLPHCINYQIGSATAIEILPGESEQFLRTMVPREIADSYQCLQFRV